MSSSGAKKILVGMLVFVGILGAGPTAAGYAWAIAWLPIYGTVCNFDKVFGSTITPDGYRIFLLNRGCDLDAAIREIAADLDPGKDPNRLVAIYHGTQRPSSTDELIEMDAVESGLRQFVMPKEVTDCAVGQDQYCAPAHYWNDDIVSSLFSIIGHKYDSYSEPKFFDAINDGADRIAAALRMGPIVQGILLLCYSVAGLVVGKLVVDFIMSFIKGSVASEKK